MNAKAVDIVKELSSVLMIGTEVLMIVVVVVVIVTLTVIVVVVIIVVIIIVASITATLITKAELYSFKVPPVLQSLWT